jgi:hypothetical protein
MTSKPSEEEASLTEGVSIPATKSADPELEAPLAEDSFAISVGLFIKAETGGGS